jgi:hypothetical protein
MPMMMTRSTKVTADNHFAFRVWDPMYKGWKVVLVERTEGTMTRPAAQASLQAQGYRNIQSAPFPA